MKRLLLVAVFMLAMFAMSAVPALAVEWHWTNQGTVAWDPVNTLVDGTTFTQADVDYSGLIFQYRVYLKDPKTGVVTELGTTTLTQYTITLAHGQRTLVGVVAEFVDAEGTVYPSSMSFSDDPTVCQNGVTFGLKFYMAPKQPLNMR